MSAGLRLGRRDLAQGIGGLWLLLACLTVAVAGLAAVTSLSSAISSTIDGQARELLGGDLALSVAQRSPTAEERAAIARLGTVRESITLRSTAQVNGQHGRPQDGRVRADENDEGDEERHGRDGAHEPGRTEPTADRDREGDHHSAVRPGHRRQVGERRRLHRGLRPGVEPAAVADRETAEEGGARFRQVRRDGDEGRRTSAVDLAV